MCAEGKALQPPLSPKTPKHTLTLAGLDDGLHIGHRGLRLCLHDMCPVCGGVGRGQREMSNQCAPTQASMHALYTCAACVLC